ncbi:hypothetical protein A2755_03540 [Candidatus Wolfebacteria bacterium RIFCSPHIGHO2_01_FULL_48_22]|uniref:Protein containing YHS domain protein n=2 Tax=Candidatus Wolfeibacteriota TaxID=1752735 RepID=A0A1F8DPQ2_9BACT|nr:MAG: hypothetical protein A2755_03540 [Candidatus Wolfebacteria bacterium RIFCSPHIGHO2_01_FULL_48_22]OGM92101.1 MAG: hypothetical protein A2935_02030 [Candidatus Wolfebacteria bacterium RIFCSPLOWO2_01_FULL_47_17b]
MQRGTKTPKKIETHLSNNLEPLTCSIDTKYKICVSGAADTTYCGDKAFDVAMELGREIVRHQAVLVDGATTGFPFWASKGAKEEGGMVIGFSPAATELEHIKSYRLPIEYHDVIVYTGSNYSGRNLQLTRSADAVIIGCGRLGTLNEFTIAFEDQKPIGVLEGAWEMDDLIKEIIAKGHRGPGKIVYAQSPKELLDKLVELIEKEKGNVE